MNFNGQTALITGAGRGIGKTIAIKLAESGLDIAIADMNPVSDDVRREIEEFGTKCLAFQLDVTDFESVESVVKKIIDETGGIHILVNNAGITQDNLFMRMTPEQWAQVIDVNLNGVFHVTIAVIRTMVKQHSGRIINISSVVGFSGNPGQVNYSSTKSGLIGFTKSLSREVGTRGITVNAVAFLASEEASYITGTVLHVNGGMY